MDSAPEISAAPEAVSLSVGATLRAAREAQGLTVEGMAERTKFSVRQVEALEADDNAHLPEGTFLRGFVRSYARVLHLDEAALLGNVPTHSGQGLEIADVQSGGVKFPVTESAARKNVYVLAGALAVALLLAIFVWTHSDSPAPEITVVETIKLPELEAVSAVAVASSVLVAVPAVMPPPAAVIKPAEPVKPAVAPESRKTAVPVPPVPVPAVVPKQAEPARTVPESRKTVVVPPASVSAVPAKPDAALEQLKKRPIHIVFSEEAWMEIVDTNGEVLLSRMNPAGSEKWIGGGRRAPYKVSIGKASAVRIYYRGREIDLSKYKQTGLVQLVLE